MLKKEVREMVKYLISERKSFKVVFANDAVEVVEYKGYCWVMNGKAYSDEELVEKMVRFQNNEKKFIIKFEDIEEVAEEVAVESTEEVENLNDDLFQESDIAYAEEAIERETHKKDFDNMTKNERDKIETIEIIIEYKLKCLNWSNEDIGFWIDGIIFNLSADHSKEFFDKLYELGNKYLGLEDE